MSVWTPSICIHWPVQWWADLLHREMLSAQRIIQTDKHSTEIGLPIDLVSSRTSIAPFGKQLSPFFFPSFSSPAERQKDKFARHAHLHIWLALNFFQVVLVLLILSPSLAWQVCCPPLPFWRVNLTGRALSTHTEHRSNTPQQSLLCISSHFLSLRSVMGEHKELINWKIS